MTIPNVSKKFSDSNALFPEHELVTEPEEMNKDVEHGGDQESVRKYEEYLKDNRNDGTSADNDWNSLEAESKKINDVVEDKTYWEFKKRISFEPEQVYGTESQALLTIEIWA